MPEHYPKHTKAVTASCRKCGRQTLHRVDNGILGSCLEQHFDGLSTAQRRKRETRELESQQPTLFDKPACNHLPVDKREFIDGVSSAPCAVPACGKR